MSEFFKDLKVVELAGVLAGPAVGMFFAELGAEVIKVENKRVGGDVTRRWHLPEESGDQPSAYFSSVNYKKKYFFSDLNEDADRQKLIGLLRDADVVIANQRPRTAEKFGLDYDSVRQINPDVIYVQLDGYAFSDRPAYDVVLQAETGWLSMTGTDTKQPAKLPVAIIDLLAGHQMKEATLLAWIKKLKTGEGSFVRCTLEQASLSALANQATNYLMAGNIAKPIGTLHPNIAPYGECFKTADDVRIVLAVGSETQFRSLADALAAEELQEDRRFATNIDRLRHREALYVKLNEAIRKWDYEKLSSKLDEKGVPFGKIKPIDEVLETSAAREMVREENIDGHETRRLTGLAFSTEFLASSEGDD